jgi:D-glucosaminate-6-phosphate ammonia-lyase
MKAGKEAVVGTIAALARWGGLDHAALRRALDDRIERLAARLAGIAGLAAAPVPDETCNPFSRLVLTIDPAAAGFTAHGLAAALSAGRPRILARALQADRGILQLDLRRLDEATLQLVGDRLLAAIAAVRQAGIGGAPALGDESAAGVLSWLVDQS